MSPEVATQVRLKVVRDVVVDTDPRRVERILVNLMANALRHGLAPVVCRVDGPVISVGDSGSGYPDEILSRGPQRFRTGASDRGSGHGLGLTIALGQARALGASLELGSSESGGARATLTLPT